MPQINLIQSGQPVADFSVSGSLITVAGVTVDCGSRQLDVASVIEIRSFCGVAQEGGDEGAYLAHIHIPAKVYLETEVPAESGDDETATTIQRTPVAIDPNAVSVTLWPVTNSVVAK